MKPTSAILVLAACLSATPTAPLTAHPSVLDLAHAGPPGETAITTARLKAHIEFLADDANEGRNSGRGPLEGTVTDYIEAEFAALSLEPMGDPATSSFRQPFQVRSWGWPEMKHDHLHPDFCGGDAGPP